MDEDLEVNQKPKLKVSNTSFRLVGQDLSPALAVLILRFDSVSVPVSSKPSQRKSYKSGIAFEHLEKQSLYVSWKEQYLFNKSTLFIVCGSFLWASTLWRRRYRSISNTLDSSAGPKGIARNSLLIFFIFAPSLFFSSHFYHHLFAIQTSTRLHYIVQIKWRHTRKFYGRSVARKLQRRRYASCMHRDNTQ